MAQEKPPLGSLRRGFWCVEQDYVIKAVWTLIRLTVSRLSVVTFSQRPKKKAPGLLPGLLVSVQADQHLAALAGLADHAFELGDPS